jgi:hypothetical protein
MYWKGDFVKELSDQGIDAHLKCAAKAPSELSLMYPDVLQRPGEHKTAEMNGTALARTALCILDYGSLLFL